MEGIARQPEAGGRIGTNMIIAAALIEGFTFFALVICFLAQGKLVNPRELTTNPRPAGEQPAGRDDVSSSDSVSVSVLKPSFRTVIPRGVLRPEGSRDGNTLRRPEIPRSTSG